MQWAACTCACFFLLMPWCALAQESVGLINAATADVTIVRQNRSLPAVPGVLLYVGDTLQTGSEGSSVAVTFADQTRMALGPQSRLILRQFVWNSTTQAGQMRAHLDRGTMAVQSGLLGTRQSGNSLDVTTPSATVRVTDAQVALRVNKSSKEKD